MGRLVVTLPAPVQAVAVDVMSRQAAGGAVDDWGFTDVVKRVQLETRSQAPHSVHIFGVRSGDAFYIASQGWRRSVGSAGDARWVRHIAADPDVRPRVGDVLYERKAIRILDTAELASVQRLFEAKYGSDAENWGFWLDPRSDEPAPWVYRLDPR